MKRQEISFYVDFYDTVTHDEGYGILQYIGQFLEDADYWSGSFFRSFEFVALTEPPPMVSEQNMCGLISTGLAVDIGLCQDVNGVDISVGQDPFIRFLEDADVAIPPDFPEDAPF